MKADYGTYSHKWLIVGPFAGAALLGGLVGGSATRQRAKQNSRGSR
jgi:hypothetical protein